MTNGPKFESYSDRKHGEGALIESKYQKRTQKVIPVNENDLKVIRDYDNDLGIIGSLGIFLVSGVLWPLVEDLLGQGRFPGQEDFLWTPILFIYFTCIFFGSLCLAYGFILNRRRKKRIMDIFQETEDYD
ncbi:MAG: hypothetical protein OXF23_05890 [Candidatus Dadabacteria bacterium]|nr:hypothetical protein [Candidatus Dadabacteria bacterium]